MSSLLIHHIFFTFILRIILVSNWLQYLLMGLVSSFGEIRWAKNKLGLLDGRNTQPEFNSPYYSFWERCNHMVKAWITNSLSRDIIVSVMCLPTAKDVWKDITDRFGQSNGSKYIQIQREIVSSSQGDSDIAGYFTKMRSLWDELNSSYVGPSSTCGALAKFIQDQQLFQFLSGLNDSYSIVKSNVLMMSPQPSLSKVYSLLQQDESQRETKSGNPNFSGDSASFSASSSHSNTRPFQQKISFDPKRTPFPGQNRSASCKYCKKTGHTIDVCHRLHGFPPNFKFTKGKKFSSCAQVDEIQPIVSQLQSVLPQCPEESTYGFSKEQYHHLLTLFQQAEHSPTFSADEVSRFAHFAGHTPVMPTQHATTSSTYGFTKEQYQHLMNLFQHAQPSHEFPGTISTGDTSGFANFAGPFSEEAIGNW